METSIATRMLGIRASKYTEPAASGRFYVLRICYGKWRMSRWTSLALNIPSPER